MNGQPKKKTTAVTTKSTTTTTLRSCSPSLCGYHPGCVGCSSDEFSLAEHLAEG
jgi:hypothetical protein